MSYEHCTHMYICRRNIENNKKLCTYLNIRNKMCVVHHSKYDGAVVSPRYFPQLGGLNPRSILFFLTSVELQFVQWGSYGRRGIDSPDLFLLTNG